MREIYFKILTQIFKDEILRLYLIKRRTLFMKIYEKLEFEVIYLTELDIIRTSLEDNVGGIPDNWETNN